ncbi:MAG: LPS-assembly protein [Thermoanaerobaculia bacterium]|jgi:LPS-assembly protein|nr:LPS-assembly protein [Thermoanaerobaculia bacterium]
MRVDPTPQLLTASRRTTPHLPARILVAAAFLLAAAPALLLAQVKDMGQAGQYYNQKAPKLRVTPGLKKKGGEVKMRAAPGGRQEFVRDEYAILEKDVVVEYQDITIHADKLTANLKTNDVVAEGHVIMDQGPTRLTADHIVFNLDSKAGTFFNATGALQPDMFFVGDKIERLSEDHYLLTNGMFTSCDLDHPSWSFHVASADVTLDDYAHMRDVSFRAHDIPLLFAPRLVWPTKRERSQGLLIPRVLLSKTYGDRLELGYFIPFGDAADTTIYADLNSKAYNGVGVNVRYRPSKDVKLGDLSAYLVHDVEAGRNQWKYKYQHSQDNLPGGFRGVVDIEDFSNLEFFRRYDRDPRLHTLSQIYSSAYLTKNRSTYSFNILTDRRDILLGNVDPNHPFASPPRQRFEQLPSLQFRLYPNRIGESPFYYSLESSMSHLATSGLLNGPTANYYRADIFPTLSMQLRTPTWLSIRPQISVRETYYSDSLSDASVANPFGKLTAVSNAVERFYAQGQVEVVGPSFSKIFNKTMGGFSKFKHVIEPRFRYLYTTDVNDQNRIIRFDTVDSPFLPIVRNSVEYSLTQRLIGRESGPNGSSREVASFSLTQSVSLGHPFTNATAGGLSGSVPQQGKFTPLVAGLHINPYSTITFDAAATFGNISHQLDQTSLSANVIGTGTRADKYLSFTWFSSYRQPPVNGVSFDSSSSQIRLNSGSSLFGDRIRADAQLNFDAKKGTFLEQRYLLGGTASCYGIALEFRRYLLFVPTERAEWSAGLSVSLKNVGTIGTH